MNATGKSALILLVTLIVGGVLGALIASRVINDRLDDLRRMRSRGGFSQALEEAIQPTSDAQRQQIQEILLRSHSRMDSISSEWRGRIRSSSDSLRAELEDVLDPAQVERMTTWFDNSRRSGRDRRGSGRSEKGGSGKSGRE